jgi:hypothetical protein
MIPAPGTGLILTTVMMSRRLMQQHAEISELEPSTRSAGQGARYSHLEIPDGGQYLASPMSSLSVHYFDTVLR